MAKGKPAWYDGTEVRAESQAGACGDRTNDGAGRGWQNVDE